jgi:uncharacterized protein
MLSNATAKTKSAPKRPTSWFWVLLAFAYVTLVFGLGLYIVFADNQKLNCALSVPSQGKKECINLETPRTREEQARGLAKYTSLPQTQGMLFDFGRPGDACMWMKDMKFPIDMVWLNEDKTVTKIERNILPDTFPQTFCADTPSRYVIELNSGIANLVGLQIGQQILL